VWNCALTFSIARTPSSLRSEKTGSTQKHQDNQKFRLMTGGTATVRRNDPDGSVLARITSKLKKPARKTAKRVGNPPNLRKSAETAVSGTI
jgi:hypothetical protein